MRTPLIAAPLAALLLSGAFPPLEWGWLAWVALAPLFYLLKWGRASAAAWAVGGWVFGAVFYAGQYAWLPRTLVELGGMGLAAFTLFSLLWLFFLALFPAAGLGVARWVWHRWGISPYLFLPLFFPLHDALFGVFPFGGVPWGSPASTQTATAAAALLAPLAGGSAVVWAIAAVNAGWAWAAEGFGKAGWRGWARGVGMAVGTLALSAGWSGPWGAGPGEPGFSALLVTGDLPVGDSQGAAKGAKLRYYLARSLANLEEAGGSGERSDRLVVWPEAALGGELQSGRLPGEISAVAGLMGADFLLGSDTREGGRGYNSAYLVTSGRAANGRYDKRLLVPFGEYVPKGFRWLFGKKVTWGEEDYRAGTAPPVLPWKSHRLGVAICFESLVPGHLRRAVLGGAGVMLVLANDQWLTAPARMQHLRLSALRGLAVGREVLFVANGGWSAHLRGGRARAMARWDDPPIWVRPQLRADLTPWVRWGYAPLGALLAGWCLLGLPGAGKGGSRLPPPAPPPARRKKKAALPGAEILS
ncbi:MAG: apolipoprotein N-acyltransferase [bacterium]